MGAIKLPIPVAFNGKTYSEAVIRPLKTSVIADTNKVVQKGDNYRAIQTFVAGGIESIGDMTDRQNIFNAVGYMPYKSAWFLAVRLIMQDEKDDGVEGLYPCPRCQTPKICEHNDDPQLDSRDFISDLKIKYLESGNTFDYTLETPVTIKDEDGNVETISKVEIQFPTLNHCSQAYSKIGLKDEIRLQLAVYVEALDKVNDTEVDRKFKNSFGMMIFEAMTSKDIRALSELAEKYGLDTRSKKVCTKCGKEWTVDLNTANFFVSALRSTETP